MGSTNTNMFLAAHRRRKGKVVGAPEVFEADALGQIGRGGSGSLKERPERLQ